MANEITVSIRGDMTYPSSYPKNESFNPGTVQITQTNKVLYKDIISVTTADAAVAIGGVGAATQGYCFLQNLDTTNYVDFGPDDTGVIKPAVRLKPNEPHAFRLVPSVTYRWQANTATCKVLIVIYGL